MPCISNTDTCLGKQGAFLQWEQSAPCKAGHGCSPGFGWKWCWCSSGGTCLICDYPQAEKCGTVLHAQITLCIANRPWHEAEHLPAGGGAASPHCWAGAALQLSCCQAAVRAWGALGTHSWCEAGLGMGGCSLCHAVPGHSRAEKPVPSSYLLQNGFSWVALNMLEALGRWSASRNAHCCGCAC